MDAANNRVNLGRICSISAYIAIGIAVACNSIDARDREAARLVVIPSTKGENVVDRSRLPTFHLNLARDHDELPEDIGNVNKVNSHSLRLRTFISVDVDGEFHIVEFQNAGRKLSSFNPVRLAPLLSSSPISQFELMVPEGTNKVIEDLLKWKAIILVHPFTKDALLIASFRLVEETIMDGGKEINIFGIIARTGELHYICGTSGCKYYGDEAADDLDIIVIQHTRQTVRAVDKRNGMEKWNFSISYYNVTFLKGNQPSNEGLEEEEGVVCEVDNACDSDSDFPLVKMDMETKIVFAVDRANETRVLWAHRLHQLHQLEGNKSQYAGMMILFSVVIWCILLGLCIGIQLLLLYLYVLIPRRIRRAAEKELNDGGEETEKEQVKPSSPELNNASDPLAQEYKSRYLTDFEHTKCLGKGGFGIVFIAKNKVDEKSYAVKRITLPNREEARDKVLREARTLAILDHSGIVRYFNSWLEEPPLGWQDIQDKKFVGESLDSNDGLTSLDTPAFFNKNSELIRNHEQLMQQMGVKSGMDPSYGHFSRARESIILKFDPSDDSNVSSEGRVNQKGDNKRAGVEFEESGSFGIVFQGTEGENSQNVSVKSDSGEETSQNLVTLDESISNRSTDTSLNNANDAQSLKDLDGSDSFQIVFEVSGCTDQPRYSDSESTQSDTSKSSENNSTPSNAPCVEGHWKEMSTHHATTPSQTSTTSSAVMKVPKIYLYIQMQLCHKETLKDWLSTNTLSRDRNKVLHIFHQILEAVNYIHGCGMIHRDLKPPNIFFSVDGEVKVGDFGLVTAIDTSMEGAEDSVDGTAGHLHTSQVGTQLYMCPEMVSGQNYDHKVDIFSLGLIFFELFHPFSTQMERIMVMCKAKRQDFPKRFTKELPLHAKFAKWLLSHDPDLRPDTDEISKSDIFRQLYEDYVPPSYHNVRNRGISNSSRQ